MTNSNHYASAEMMIRKPIEEVFQSFIDPDITSKFWFSRGSGKLVEGTTVEWFWDMYGFSVPVQVKQVSPHKSIVVDWGEELQKSTIEWTFKKLTNEKTYVTIKNDGFRQEGDELLSVIRDSTGGFTFLISACKAYLEHGVELKLVADKNPPELLGSK